MSKLVLHKRLGRLQADIIFNEEVMYKASLDSVRIVDTFYLHGNRDKTTKSYMREF